MKKQSNYSEQVKSPLWQKKRLEVLNLRGFKCEICGNEKDQLHVHHRFYIKGRKIHEYDNDVLQVLCEKCHESEHEKQKKTVKHDAKYDGLINCIEILQDMSEYGQVHEQLSYFLSNLITMNSPNFINNLSLISNFTDFELILRYVNMFSKALDMEIMEEQLKNESK
jgi:hypothetical protein